MGDSLSHLDDLLVSSGELAFRNLVAIKLIYSSETRYKVAIWVHIVRLDLSLYRFGGVY